VSIIRTLATSLFPSVGTQAQLGTQTTSDVAVSVPPGMPALDLSDDQPAQRHIAGRKFRRFGRLGADGRVITYTDHAPADRAHRLHADDDRYLDHEIDTQTYGKPLPISGQLFGQGGWGQ
jgi:hypothetical protein